MHLRPFILLFLICLSCTISARQIEAVVGWAKPPYIMQDGDSGFEIELVRQIFADMGHELVPLFVPYGRSMMMVDNNDVDIGLTMSKRQHVSPAILSDPYVVYQNVAVTLRKRHIALNSLADFSGLSVVAFQTASEVLGPEFAAATTASRGYLEVPDQSRQVRLLMLGSIDVAVMDRNIFMHLKRKLPASKQLPVQVHELFPASPYSAAIPDDELRRQFNQHLAAFISDGRYQALIEQFGLVNLLDRIPTPKH